MESKIISILSKMTVEEKISLCSGRDLWNLEYFEEYGVPKIQMCDGPHGLRKRLKNEKGEYYGVKATCFPSAATMANSWDTELVRRVGEYIGDECRAEQISILLGPGINIKRAPNCGRNFEYYSEDPYLSGKMASGFIRGVQSRGIATCAKHFCVNNQETRRFTTSANVSERALHEIYLTPFEIAVKEANVQAIMHSYNRVNGKYVSERGELVTDLLRKKWGFNGYVMSDWWAMSDRVAAYKAGVDVEMPSSGGVRDREVLEAYKKGEISIEQIDASVANILRVVLGHLPSEGAAPYDVEEHHLAAAKAAEECMVLLKNEGGILPLASGKPLAVIGRFAKCPRIQGGGSSHVEPNKVDDITEFIANENKYDITYADGYDENHETTDTLISEAVNAARKCGRAVIFAGMPGSYETEGRDRRHMKLPPAHNALIEAVSAACDKVVVVLMAGSPNEMPWIHKVPALLHAYLGGQALGGAVARILFGKVNPCGKLAETYPLRFEDNPAYINFPGNGDNCLYGEDIYVGYRYYDKRKMDVLFPFGYGLSYTKFEYTSINVQENTVKVTVKNVGDRAGKEVVQLYVGCDRHPYTYTFVGMSAHGYDRAERSLIGFEKVHLEAGEEKTVEFPLQDRFFSVYDEDLGDFKKIGGDYELYAGGSSRDLPLCTKIAVEESTSLPVCIAKNMTFEDILLNKSIPSDIAESFIRSVLAPKLVAKLDELGFSFDNPVLRRKRDSVLRQSVGSRLTPGQLDELIDAANAEIEKRVQNDGK
ncbi:MAG: glycoside hydrolase family 3 C-terminal domain-containing protein [Clostridia bacterium]|nr:glycoside hydrolase family 3 C-terminal domain-containing protein [Clostridia bacterium]